MSKKSRRRNKKILGALGALGLGLALANKGKGTGVSGSDKAKFTSDAAYSMPKDDMELKETIVSMTKHFIDLEQYEKCAILKTELEKVERILERVS